MSIILGGLDGLAAAFLILAFRSRFTYLGGGYGRFEGPGCGASLLLYLLLGAAGAVIGALVRGG